MKERYAKDLIVEANTLKTLVQQQILPSAYEYRKDLAVGAKNMVDIGIDASAETTTLTELSKTLSGFQDLVTKLTEVVDEVESNEHEQAKNACKNIIPLMEEIRVRTDKLEEVVADKHWALPKNTEILFY
ncbi:hypothetical protein K7432_014476 [Basidiobolus ranarum]|uniref:Glutamine synthetase C-terminal domain-containing protein n=1 Tax=Basidiobolus ranarum TaxID=34480 RepID=A0ABR2WHI7_9FUNG